MRKVVSVFFSIIIICLSIQAEQVFAQGKDAKDMIEWVVKPKYDLLGHFDDKGYAMIGYGGQSNFQFGFINEKGDVVIEPIFSTLSDFDKKTWLAPE